MFFITSSMILIATRGRHVRSGFLAAILWLGAGTSVMAQSTWMGPTGGQWGASTNWSPNGIPNGVNTTVIWTNAAQPYLTAGGPFMVGTIRFLSGSGSLAFGSDSSGDLLTAATTAGSPTLFVTNNGNVYFYVVLSGTQGFAKTGPGAVTFRYNSWAQPYTGTVQILGGTLGIQADYSLGNTNNPVVITNGACLAEESSANAGVFWLSPARTITLAGAQAQLAVSSAADTLVIPGGINENPAGSGLLWNSAGALVLSNANTFTGALTMTAGTNDLANANALQYATLTVNGGVLQFDRAVSGRAFTVGNLAGATAGATFALQNNATSPAAITLTAGGNNSSNVFSGNITGPGSLIKVGSGTLALLGTSTYTGTTAVNAGRLMAAAGSTFTGAVTVADGATNGVQVTAAGQTLVNSSLTLGTSTGATLEFNNQVLISPTIPMLSVTNLTLKGTNKVNIVGPPFSYEVGMVPLLVYGAKTGGGTWLLNTLPAGITASLHDTGSELQLLITAVSDPLVTETVSISATNAGYAINPAFCGFSYEKAQMAGSLLVSNDTSLVGMLSQLGPGVFRIGAASVDSTCWNGLSNCPAITAAEVDALAGFVKALPTNWSVIYGINQVSNTAANCAAEAAYVANALGSRLQGFEIGNEPDLYHDYYRPSNYNYANFLAEWQPFAAAITNSVPGWAVTNHGAGWTFTGPATSWSVAGYTLPFVTNESAVISMATHHYYRDSATSTNATMAELLTLDTNLAGTVGSLVATANHFSLPQGFRVDEAGSYAGGGNTNSAQYGAALWALDVMFTIAANGGQGINFHGGGNGTSSYTPIGDNGSQVVEVRPEYYALKLFSLAAHGSAVPAAMAPAPAINFSAYGIRYPNGAQGALLNNKDTTNGVQLTINLGTNTGAAQVMLLSGPAPNATSGYTLGGATINTDGTWPGGFQYTIPATNGALALTVQPMTAVWLSPILAPHLTAVTNRSLTAGNVLAVTNQASDPNVPSLALAYTLAAAPGGAGINVTSGLVVWRPAIAQGGTSNLFTVVVTNTAGAAAAQSFWVTVTNPTNPVLSSPGVSAGHFHLTISGSYGPDYAIQGTTNLARPSWQTVFSSNMPAPPFLWTDTNALRSQYYYRVLLGP